MIEKLLSIWLISTTMLHITSWKRSRKMPRRFKNILINSGKGPSKPSSSITQEILKSISCKWNSSLFKIRFGNYCKIKNRRTSCLKKRLRGFIKYQVYSKTIRNMEVIYQRPQMYKKELRFRRILKINMKISFLISKKFDKEEVGKEQGKVSLTTIVKRAQHVQIKQMKYKINITSSITSPKLVRISIR